MHVEVAWHSCRVLSAGMAQWPRFSHRVFFSLLFQNPDADEGPWLSVVRALQSPVECDPLRVPFHVLAVEFLISGPAGRPTPGCVCLLPCGVAFSFSPPGNEAEPLSSPGKGPWSQLDAAGGGSRGNQLQVL